MENRFRASRAARTRRLALAVSLSLSVAACGGGGVEPAAPPGPPAPPAEPPRFTGLQNFQRAATVLGQQNFASSAANQGVDAVTPTSLSTPQGVAVGADGRLFIADGGNHRVLGFAAPLSEASGAAAAFALGQPDLFQGDVRIDEEAYDTPTAISIGNGKMAVADAGKNRVVIYDIVPGSGVARPSAVVGQVNLADNDTTCDRVHLSFPRAVHITPDGKLLVADTNHSRVLIWKSLPGPGQHGVPADVVLGQAGFDACDQNGGGAAPSRASMRGPEGVWSDGTRVAVADTLNNRVLLWDSILMGFPTGQEPHRVLGQDGFDSATAHPPQADSLRSPRGLAFNGTHLAVADQGYNRVLLWTGWPSQVRQAAQTVLGQLLFTRREANDVGGDGVPDSTPDASTLSGPSSVAFHENKLLVTDRSNHRVLIFKSN